MPGFAQDLGKFTNRSPGVSCRVGRLGLHEAELHGCVVSNTEY